EEVVLLHVLHGRLPPHGDRLRDGGVAPVLERGLHPDMPFWRHVVGRREDPLPLLRDLLQAPGRSVVAEDFLDEVLAPEAFAPRDFLEVVEEVREFLALHDALVPNQAELRLATARRVRNHRERARRGDGGDVRVAEPQAFLLVAAALPRRIDAALPRELRALLIFHLLDILLDLADSLAPL